MGGGNKWITCSRSYTNYNNDSGHFMIYIVWYLTDKGEHTALYKINKNVYVKPQIIYNTVFHDLGISFGISSREITGMCQEQAQFFYKIIIDGPFSYAFKFFINFFFLI